VIKNDDYLCLAKALCAGILRHVDTAGVYASIRLGQNMQAVRTRAPCEEAGVSLDHDGRIDHLDVFQQHI
jgi:hypothetical protein